MKHYFVILALVLLAPLTVFANSGDDINKFSTFNVQHGNTCSAVTVGPYRLDMEHTGSVVHHAVASDCGVVHMVLTLGEQYEFQHTSGTVCTLLLKTHKNDPFPLVQVRDCSAEVLERGEKVAF